MNKLHQILQQSLSYCEAQFSSDGCVRLNELVSGCIDIFLQYDCSILKRTYVVECRKFGIERSHFLLLAVWNVNF